jgi:hypothetical protein
VTDPSSDPGRIRVYALLGATYGETPRAVEAALVSVWVHGAAFRVHRNVRAALVRVDARLRSVGDSVAPYFRNVGGGYHSRKIAGTDRMSAHAYGIAVDLDPSRGDYWRTARTPSAGYRNRVPEEIVHAFEAEGFAWGGRWYHYDTMHFEYRPELLDASCWPPEAAEPLPVEP